MRRMLGGVGSSGGGVVDDGYTIEAFTSSGTWDWEAAGSPETVEVLVVAGGGGGGRLGGGGGGGGEFSAAGGNGGSGIVLVRYPTP